jgi:tetratricopeptide (TPR) repeat protein
MRPFVAVLVFFCVRADPALAQQAYAGVLLEYLTGDAGAAVEKVRKLDRSEILAGVYAFNTTRARMVLPGAAALHTEAALRQSAGGTPGTVFDLHIATALVEFGEGLKLKSNSQYSISPATAAPVSAEFRRLWYCAVIEVLLDNGKAQAADAYLAHALALFPANAEIQLLAGISEEMRASPRISNLSAGDRRDESKRAETHYRRVLAINPDRLEARLRLGRLLQQRNALTEARAMLTPLVETPDARIAYLAQLFLGGIEDATGKADAAAALYDGAAALIPNAQTARLAASELRHRRGERQAAADAVPAAAGDTNTFDPWWTYVFGEYWRRDLLLDALRKLRRA